MAIAKRPLFSIEPVKLKLKCEVFYAIYLTILPKKRGRIFNILENYFGICICSALAVFSLAGSTLEYELFL